MYDPFKEPGEVLYFSSNGTVKDFRAGETYYVLRTTHGLAISERRSHDTIGLLSALKQGEYCPLKKLSFHAMTFNGAPRYMPTAPIPPPKPGKKKGAGAPKSDTGGPLLLSQVHFDLNERISVYNRENTQDSLEFRVTDKKPC